MTKTPLTGPKGWGIAILIEVCYYTATAFAS